MLICKNCKKKINNYNNTFEVECYCSHKCMTELNASN